MRRQAFIHANGAVRIEFIKVRFKQRLGDVRDLCQGRVFQIREPTVHNPMVAEFQKQDTSVPGTQCVRAPVRTLDSTQGSREWRNKSG